MKSSHVALFALVLLTGGFSLLWFSLWDDDVPGVEVDAEPDRAPAPEATALDLGHADEERAEAVDLTQVAGEPRSRMARQEILPPADFSQAALEDRPSGIVRGGLRDEETGEALPDYLLRISDAAGRREDVVSDAQGEFTTAAKMVQGTISVDFLDHPRRERPVARKRYEHLASMEATGGDGTETTAAAYDFAVASGPTFWVDLQPVRDIQVAALEARLRRSGPEGRQVSDPEPVRTSGGLWIRFGPMEVPEATGKATGEAASSESIEVSSPDGYWRGTAKVLEARGRVPGVIAIKLAPFAVLTVRVVDQDGSPVGDANLSLEGKNTAGKPIKAGGRSLSDGTFTFKYLAEGDGALAVRSMYHAPRDAPVHLVARESTSLDVVLEKLPIVGAIRGRILSDTGTYTPRVFVSLAAPADTTANGKGLSPLRTEVRWETVEGRDVGVFAFEGLPKGEYRLDLKHPEDFFSWEPGRLVLAPPSEAAVFRVRDAVPNAGIAFRVRDGDNGLLLDGLRITLDIRGRGAPRIFNASSNQVLYEHMPYDRRMTWRIDKEDYQPAFGDELSFSAEELRGDLEVRCADIHLDPGWGDVFLVARGQRNGGTPIEGAHILFDGREAGVTGQDGTVRLFAKRKPAHVACTYKNWSVVGKIDLSPPWARPNRNVIRVEMRPPPPKKKAPEKK